MEGRLLKFCCRSIATSGLAVPQRQGIQGSDFARFLNPAGSVADGRPKKIWASILNESEKALTLRYLQDEDPDG